MIQYKKILLTLVALFTMTAGAWADPNILAPTITGDREFYESVEVTMICTSPNADIYYTVNGKDPKTLPDNQQIEYKDPITLMETTTIMARAFDGNDWSAMVEVTFTKQTGPKVTWDAATKTGSFTMPAYDVEIAPIYAPAAQWAKVENVDQIPAAIEGIFAGTTDAIVKAGIVAMMGKTENPQGTVMYAVTSTNQATAPELSAFSADVPTAKDIADEGADVLIWYYIQGANTPDGEEATAENTFNDSEICATPIKVTVLSNKFDITFNAANANTIEAGKATVTVGGTDKTVTEGKLEGVKMGSEVKMTAKDGYKFKKVEAKKKSVGPVLNLTNPAVGQVIGSDGKNYAYASLPTGVTAVAKICYVSGSNGLALALKDFGIDGFVSWNTVKAALETYEPKFTNATWDMPTEDEWNQMNHTAGGYGALRDSFTGVGGTNMTDGAYWSSTSDPNDDTKAKNFSFNNGEWGSYQKSANRFTRLRLAW